MHSPKQSTSVHHGQDLLEGVGMRMWLGAGDARSDLRVRLFPICTRHDNQLFLLFSYNMDKRDVKEPKETRETRERSKMYSVRSMGSQKLVVITEKSRIGHRRILTYLTCTS